MANTPLQQLAEHGQSVWIDYLSRPFVAGRRPRRAWSREGVVGVTSNPTIFQARDRRGRRLRRPAPRGRSRPRRPSRRRSSSRSPRDDIRDACDILQAVWDDGRRQGRLGLARGRPEPRARHAGHDRRGQAPARDGRPRRTCSSRSPRRSEGLPAIEETIAAGIPVNVTLIFSLERHREVAEAYIRGLQRLVGRRRRPRRKIASVASFFVSRVDTEADKRLDEIGGHDELKGTLAIANAKLAYQTYKEIFSGDAVGGAGRQGRQRRSAACGRRPRPRTPTTATSSTSRS